MLKPRWFSSVLRAVGLLMGEGEIGRGNGDFGALTREVVGTERESLGLAARSIFVVSCFLRLACLRWKCSREVSLKEKERLDFA